MHQLSSHRKQSLYFQPLIQMRGSNWEIKKDSKRVKTSFYDSPFKQTAAAHFFCLNFLGAEIRTKRNERNKGCHNYLNWSVIVSCGLEGRPFVFEWEFFKSEKNKNKKFLLNPVLTWKRPQQSQTSFIKEWMERNSQNTVLLYLLFKSTIDTLVSYYCVSLLIGSV